MGKISRRLTTTPLSIAKRPDILELHQPFQPFSFPSVDVPKASLVIPVFNKYPVTFHCLAALQRHRSSCSFEVIVVDDCSTDETPGQLARFESLRAIWNRENLGFVGSCNVGAASAHGDFLVFLNNDTQVQPGWPDALIETFIAYSEAGLVGSRLIFPDGRQQEAGGILAEDGSSWNYGHQDDP